MTPTPNDHRKFYSQKYHAERNAIPFKLTFDEWWDWWQQTGHYHERGSGKGMYQMARLDIKEAYELGNLACVTSEQKTSRNHLGRRKKRVTGGSLLGEKGTQAAQHGGKDQSDPGLTLAEAIALMRMELSLGRTPNRVPMSAKPLDKADFVDHTVKFAHRR